MAKGLYRRKIRINGVLTASPGFEKKRDADEWYDLMKKKKNFTRFGIQGGVANVETFIDYSRKWMQDRIKNYPKSTWLSDEQRLRDYVLPELASVPMDRITAPMIKAFLKSCQVEHELSHQTMIRIRSLCSKIFNDALNDDPPRVQFNPVTGVSLEGRRVGKYKPVTLESPEEALAYMKAARKAGPMERILACILMGSGVRKSELCALQWGDFNLKAKTLNIQRHVEQASLEIKPGTKAGQLETRVVPIPIWLVKELELHKSKAEFQQKSDFILCDDHGEWIRPRKLSDIHERILAIFGKRVTPHQVRHSFGRLFAMYDGNLRALQLVLGHSSATTTQLYSELSGSQIRTFGEALSLLAPVDEENE